MYLIVSATTVFCILAALIGFFRSRFLLNPITVMFALWGIIVPVSSLGLYGVTIPSEKAYSIILIGLIGFFIGSMVGWTPTRFKIVVHKKKDQPEDNRLLYAWNKRLLYTLIVISMIYYIYKLVLVVGMLRSGADFSVIRELVTAEETNVLRSSGLIIAVQALIASPTTFLMIAILPIEILKEKEKDRTLIRLSVAMLILWVITTGGRWVIAWFALYFACVFLMQKKKRNRGQWRRLLRKYRTPILVGAGLLFMGLLFMTFSRKGNNVDLLQETYIYTVAPVPFFDYHISNIDANYSNVMGYGISSFYGIIYPVLFIIRMFTGAYPEKILDIYHMSFYMLERPHHIGGNIWMNAYVTAFFQPYIDGRMTGVFIILLILGFACGKAFYMARYKMNEKALLIYILLLQKVMFSFVRFYFTMQPQGISFILAFLAMKKMVYDPTKSETENKH